MSERSGPSRLVFVLGALCAGAIAAAVLVVGAPEQSSAEQSRTVTVRDGVVQSTVSGSGNIQSATQLNLGFKTAGVVSRIEVAQGARVVPGELLAELDPQSAEVTLEAAKATLQAAEAALAQEEETGGETSSGSSGSGGSGGRAPAGTKGSSSSSSSGSSSTPKQSAATRQANLASARATVRSDRFAVVSDEQAVADTKLYAPTNGTLVSLSGEVGESVSGTGTSRASSTSSGSSSSGSGAGSATGGKGGTGAGSSSSSSSSSAFAVLSDLGDLQLVVPLSESEVTKVRVGQPATVTIEALEGAKVAAHVSAVSSVATSNSGVVSYDVTFKLDQSSKGVKPGMSATAEVVVAQAEGVSVPTRAISGGSVTIVHGGQRTRRSVVTGLAGDSSTIVLSGLSAGEQIALPISSGGGSSGLTSLLRSRLGGGGLGGGLGGGGGAVFAAPRGGG